MKVKWFSVALAVIIFGVAANVCAQVAPQTLPNVLIGLMRRFT